MANEYRGEDGQREDERLEYEQLKGEKMTKENFKNSGVYGYRFFAGAAVLLCVAMCVAFCGCSGFEGYSNESMFAEDVQSVYVEMFDNESFRRGVEYKLTEAVSKRIEAETPYKIVSNRSRADTLISGYITSAGEATLVAERETGRSLEKDVDLSAVVSWKNLKTGELLIDGTQVSASASYSEWQNQSFDYASSVAVNKLAQQIVELMEKPW